MFFKSIHYLRAVAALAVVVFHVGGQTSFPEIRILMGGVDLFFVISGFVMVTISRGALSPAQFLMRRALRIYPMYWAAMIATLIILGRGANDPTFWRDMLLIPEQVASGEGRAFSIYTLAQAWTLAYEMFFYLVFAVCLGRWVPTALVITGFAAAWHVWPAAYSNPIILEFVFGMAIAATPRHVVERWAAPALAVGLNLFAAMSLGTEFPNRATSLGIPAALVVFGLVGLERKIPHIPALHFLGSASYCIYLFHFIGIMPLAWSWPLALAAGVGIGCLAHVTLERPALRTARKLRAA